MKTSTIKFCIMFLALFAFTSVSAQHFNFVGGDEAFENWQINIYEAINTADAALEADDEIAVFDGSNLVGHIILTNTPSINNWYDNVLVAYTQLEDGSQGYEAGNAVTFVAWDRNIGQEVVLDTVLFHPEWYAPHNSATFPAIWTYSYVSVKGGGTTAYGDIFGVVKGLDSYAAPYSDLLDSVFVIINQKGAYTNTDGEFAIEGIKTGNHNVTFSKYGWGDKIIPVVIGDGLNLDMDTIQMDTMPTAQHYPFIPIANTAKESWQLHIYETDLNGVTLDENDEVVVYDGNTMVGHIRLINTPSEMNWFENTLWCWSEFADGSKGYTFGNTPKFYAWDQSAQLEYEIELDFHDTWYATVDSLQYFGDSAHQLNQTFPDGYDYSYVSLSGSETELYTLSGTVDTLGGGGFVGAVITINDQTDTTDASGDYSITFRAGEYDATLKADGYETKYHHTDLTSSNDTWDTTMKVFSRHFPEVLGNAVEDLWTLYIESATIQAEDMIDQDEVAIYDGAKLVGSIVLNQVCTPENRGENDLIAFTAPIANGYTPGNVYTFKGYDISETQEFTLFTSTLKPSGAYTGLTFPTDENTYSHLNIDFQNPPGDISGEHNVPGAYVYATATTGNQNRVYSAIVTDNSATTGDTTYAINNILSGYSYEITSEAAGWNDYTGSTHAINPGSSITEDITLTENGYIEGWVKDNAGAPGPYHIVGALVELLDTLTGEILYTGITDTGSTNNLHINGIEVGKYDWIVRAVGYDELSNTPPADRATILSGVNSFDKQMTPATNKTQLITITEGYQFVSRNVEPTNINMETIATNAGISTNLNYVLDNYDSTLTYSAPDYDNEIGDWLNDEGYQFVMNTGPASDVTITLNGPYINGAIVPIELTPGDPVMIPYIQVASEDVDSVFAAIKDSLDWVKNTTGHKLRKINGVWIDNIGDMNPGEGYQVQMIGNATLLYDKDWSSKSMNPPADNSRERELQYFEFAGGNPESYVYTIYIQAPDFEVGDEIAVYDGSRLVGAMVLEDNGTLYNDLIAFRYVMDGVGYTPGNEFSFKGYDASTGYLYDLSYELAPANPEVYLESTFPNGRGHYSIAVLNRNLTNTVELARNAVKVFPNPTQGQVSIESPFDIYDVAVMDITGKVIYTSQVNNTRTQLSTELMINGVYFIRLTTEEGILTQKLIVNK